MKHFFTIVAVFAVFLSQAQTIDQFYKSSNQFFATYVQEGKVKYSEVAENIGVLDEILKEASNMDLSALGQTEIKAYWINVYNLGVIKIVVEESPIKSPLDVDGFFDIKQIPFNGKQLSLNAIEHDILRAKYMDPRLHFVLVCGAVGCPPLISKAYIPSTLEQQLEEQTRLALNGNFVKVNTKRKKIQVTELFKWYKSDFTMNHSTVIDFINKYRPEKIPTNYKLEYYPYDWSINSL
ncbi:MAG: DUF547 domain-containing protein [Bacteroidetes bacterium MedPE-SWsnd-G2]|nr:MAG: DUF547 domain-containing protein [Bacteroidetes bacterium MedPE-SWsnd-G2]